MSSQSMSFVWVNEMCGGGRGKGKICYWESICRLNQNKVNLIGKHSQESCRQPIKVTATNYYIV